MADKDQFERFLRTPEAARLLGLSPRTLEKHRTYGTGPRYRKLGGRVVYAIADIRAWADIGLRESTNDPNARVIPAAKPLVLKLTPRTGGTR
ncbi:MULTISPECIES: helix-turn-helix domain-containing protein [Afipia]|uniref:Putative DNA-binding transcriptional regulator AlpA n=1 Tax=Afipia massiliensis TaxID=211460 RepID=A0A840MU08_9BRAD|nr:MULTISPECIES: helix-turn-helix domain-containing protein [Afipia]MBB5051869.1 putative DNA-binding transcriptional regulator AlpA [Afipia massiliensis]MCR6736068.1 helix-turn-helix domain-containing protein [Afipia sp.]